MSSEPKHRCFDRWSEHTAQLQVWSPEVCTKGNPHITVSHLSPSLPLSKIKNKIKCLFNKNLRRVTGKLGVLELQEKGVKASPRRCFSPSSSLTSTSLVIYSSSLDCATPLGLPKICCSSFSDQTSYDVTPLQRHLSNRTAPSTAGSD